MAVMSDPDHQENQMSRHAQEPSSRQLHYLRILAERSGTTFASPSTRREASRQILRLQALSSLTLGERRGERRALDADRERLAPASAINPGEISGYGAHARWAKR
jgi:hypothetical protein